MSILFGLAFMAFCCGFALRFGGPPEKRLAAWLALCWLGATAGEFAPGSRMEPLIVGDFVYGAGLLALTWWYDRAWLWGAVCLQAAYALMHALMYERGAPVSLLYVVANNVLSGLPLMLLLGVSARRAWADRRRG